MITNTGKSIMAKYLVGQSPAYASYIAIGCGAKPLSGLQFAITNKEKSGTFATLESENHGLTIGQVVDIVGVDADKFDGTYEITAVTADTFSYTSLDNSNVSSAAVSPVGYAYPNFKNKTRLDFESIRVPIISRGYVTEELDSVDEFGQPEKISKIVLTAELPTADRYEISEIGVFSAQGNPLASNSDSRTLYSFSSNEGWAYHSADTNVATSIPNITKKLDNGNSTNDIVDEAITVGGVVQQVFQAQASNSIFLSDYRTKRFEQPRFLDNTIFMSGRSSKLDVDNLGNMTVDAEWTDGSTYKSNHIHLTNARLNFDNNSVTDELRFAFSVVSRDEDSELDDIPSNVRVMLEFSSTDAYNEGQFARFEVDLYDISVADEDLPDSRTNVAIADLSKNRYFAVSRKIEELTKSSGFSWEIVKTVKVYVSVSEADGDPTDKYFVCLDGLRFENVATANPLYGMVGYTVVNNNENNQPRTIIKSPNSTNYVEFRFAVDA